MKSKVHILKKAIFQSMPGSPGDLSLPRHEKTGPAGFHIDFTGEGYAAAKKILVADDDPSIIDVLTLMLEHAGYKVYSSANLQTIADINRISPDLVLLDVLMSGINGFDICKHLKSQPSTSRIPVIIISASKNKKQTAIKAGAEDFISKPFEMDELLQKVAKYSNISHPRYSYSNPVFYEK
jgi:CheY-like chemotaxis protein